MEVELIVIEGNKSTSHYIPSSWIPRWDYLKNIVEEMNVTTIEWTYSSNEEILLWIELNTIMSFPIGRARDRRSVSTVSAMWRTLQFMDPVDGDYLLDLLIDEELPPEQRRRYYYDLGFAIRSRGRAYPYVEDVVSYHYIHSNCDIRRDLAYGLRYGRDTVSMMRLGEEVRDAILKSDLSTLTGILHTAWKHQYLSDYVADIEYSEEIPWQLIRWNDVVDMCPNAFFPGEDMISIIYAIVKRDNRIVQADIASRTVAIRSGSGYVIGALSPLIDSILARQVDFSHELAQLIQGDEATRILYGSNYYGNEVVQKQNLRVMLAGRLRSEVPVIPLPILEETSVNKIRGTSRLSPERALAEGLLSHTQIISHTVGGRRVIRVSSPVLLLDRIYAWNEQFPATNSNTVMNIVGQVHDIWDSSVEMRVGDLTDLINMIMRDYRVDGSVPTADYKKICMEIYSTLGTECLIQVANSAVEEVTTATADIVTRLELLVLTALEIVDTLPKRGFTDWPAAN